MDNLKDRAVRAVYICGRRMTLITLDCTRYFWLAVLTTPTALSSTATPTMLSISLVRFSPMKRSSIGATRFLKTGLPLIGDRGPAVIPNSRYDRNGAYSGTGIDYRRRRPGLGSVSPSITPVTTRIRKRGSARPRSVLSPPRIWWLLSSMGVTRLSQISPRATRHTIVSPKCGGMWTVPLVGCSSACSGECGTLLGAAVFYRSPDLRGVRRRAR